MDVEGIDPVAVYAALMSTLVRTVFAQPDAASAWAQHARVVDQLVAERVNRPRVALAAGSHRGLGSSRFPLWASVTTSQDQHSANSQARKKSPHQNTFRFWYSSISSSWRSL